MDKGDQLLLERHWVEQLGLHLEESGIPRMAGKILGRLLICVPESQSAAELADWLFASRASISTNTRLLIHMGLIEKAPSPGGGRTALLRIRPGAWSTLLQGETLRATLGARLFKEGLAMFPDRVPAQLSRLAEAAELYTFLAEEFPAVLARWEASRRK